MSHFKGHMVTPSRKNDARLTGDKYDDFATTLKSEDGEISIKLSFDGESRRDKFEITRYTPATKKEAVIASGFLDDELPKGAKERVTAEAEADSAVEEAPSEE